MAFVRQKGIIELVMPSMVLYVMKVLWDWPVCFVDMLYGSYRSGLADAC
jgi:hypothetical protein